MSGLHSHPKTLRHLPPPSFALVMRASFTTRAPVRAVAVRAVATRPALRAARVAR